MINTWIGNLGHLSVIIAFIASVVATFGYYQASSWQDLDDFQKQKSWRSFSRIAFLIHSLGIFGIIGALFYIISNHLYEYHYAWNHASNYLPVQYMISCFWEGQEGSFLLWMFWNVVLGAILILTNRIWEPSVMTVFSAVQAFLASMILGVVIFDIKIGSDPFILLRDAMSNVPVFNPSSDAYNPNFIPEDGTGLNPLLQNYWMVIHPPTLFLGFATTLIPFAYCIAGLWKKEYKSWIRPALPWALFSGAVLGLGILMGGYWAYETLNFGGYWNWDPVENAIYVPWLVLIATIHTMIAFKKNSTALKAAMILAISTFILILYSTFLTRSGVLGSSSVHSFTDLGLSGQLLVYLLAFTFLSIFLLMYRWKSIPTTKQEVSVYSREFWIFVGATVLCLAGFQTLLTISIPVYNSIIEAFGGSSNMAPPADQVEHYTKFQLWTGVFIALLSGTGQFFWWKKMDEQRLQVIVYPIIAALLISSAWILWGEIRNWKFIILLTASIYSIVANAFILFTLLRKSTFKLAGGSLAHIGVAMMLLGILYSSGYSKVVSKNTSGLLYSTDFSDEVNENNVLLWLGQPIKMKDYTITYTGDYVESPDFPEYINKEKIYPSTKDPNLWVTLEDLTYNDRTYFKEGDTVQIFFENTYYRVEYRDQKGRVFSLFPRTQINEQMGGLLPSPSIMRQASRDLYTHVSSIPNPEEERQWSETQVDTLAIRDTMLVNDYFIIFEDVNVTNPNGTGQPSANDLIVNAQLRVLGRNKSHLLQPAMRIRNNQLANPAIFNRELGLSIKMLNIDPTNGVFTFESRTTQKDYIIMKAIEKPLINVLWIGTLVLMLGFGVATYRRYGEFVKMRNKGLEV